MRIKKALVVLLAAALFAGIFAGLNFVVEAVADYPVTGTYFADFDNYGELADFDKTGGNIALSTDYSAGDSGNSLKFSGGSVSDDCQYVSRSALIAAGVLAGDSSDTDKYIYFSAKVYAASLTTSMMARVSCRRPGATMSYGSMTVLSGTVEAYQWSTISYCTKINSMMADFDDLYISITNMGNVGDVYFDDISITSYAEKQNINGNLEIDTTAGWVGWNYASMTVVNDSDPAHGKVLEASYANAYSTPMFMVGEHVVLDRDKDYVGHGSGYYRITYDIRANVSMGITPLMQSNDFWSGSTAYFNVSTGATNYITSTSWTTQSHVFYFTEAWLANAMAKTTGSEYNIGLRLDASSANPAANNAVIYLDNVKFEYLAPVSVTVNDSQLVTCSQSLSSVYRTQSLTFTATENSTSFFKHWLVDGEIYSTNRIMTIPADTFEITPVYFDAKPSTVTISVPEYNSFTYQIQDQNPVTVNSSSGSFRVDGGKRVTVTVPEDANRTFYGWGYTGSQRIIEQNSSYSFVAFADVNLQANSVDASSKRLIFMDYTSAIIDSLSVSGTLDNSAYPTAPARMGHVFSGWSKSINDINDFITDDSLNVCIVTAQYAKIEKQYTVSITGPAGSNATVVDKDDLEATPAASGQFLPLSVARITAEETNGTNVFAYWQDSRGNKISYERTYLFYVFRDLSITAVYLPAAQAAQRGVIIGIVRAARNSGNSITFAAERFVPEGYVVKQHGIIVTKDATVASNDATFILGASKTSKGVAIKNSNLGTYVATRPNAGTVAWYGRAFITYNNGTEDITLYSPIEMIEENMLPTDVSNFDNVNAFSEAEWAATLINSNNVALTGEGYEGTNGLRFTVENADNSPSLNINKYFNAAGTYRISFKYQLDFKNASSYIEPGDNVFRTVLRGGSASDINSFILENSGQYLANLKLNANPSNPDHWYDFTCEFEINSSDLVGEHVWNLCFDTINTTNIEAIILDDFSIVSIPDKDLITGVTSNFNDATTVTDFTGWNTSQYIVQSNVSVDDNGYTGKCLEFTGTAAYHSPCINLYPLIKQAGEYSISFKVRFDLQAESYHPFYGLIRGGGAADANSFIKQDGTNYYKELDAISLSSSYAGEWVTYNTKFYVQADDLVGQHTWYFLVHKVDFANAVNNIYIDDFTVTYAGDYYEGQYFIPRQTDTWVATEYTFESDSDSNGVNGITDKTLDVTFTHTDGTTMTMPGFWNGHNIWKVRFAPTKAGTWTYTLACSDPSDSGLQNTGTLVCNTYTGDLDIYKKGFIKSQASKKYFTYANGDPFFYLGDTHWAMMVEEFDSAGEKAGSLVTDSHFKYIVDKRVEQGFTVYQSQPNEAGFNLTNGMTQADINGFCNLDRYFEYIAEKGLVHAHSQFFFPNGMFNLLDENGILLEGMSEYLEAMSRYWVARYAAYPVMFTLGQEIDNDFYYNENTATNVKMNAASNPYRYVCTWLNEYDPYKNMITGHQESSSFTKISNSAFNDVNGHSWFGLQWSPAMSSQESFSVPKIYWANSKVTVLYEGLYDHLWTTEIGARMQGWQAYLNGMFGYGYGAQDIWAYKNSYSSSTASNMNGQYVSIADKFMPWSQTIELAGGYQTGYIAKFFKDIEWSKLIPRFNTGVSYTPATNARYVAASSASNDLIVVYLYNIYDNKYQVTGEETQRAFSNVSSVSQALEGGTITGLNASATYRYKWYNPRTGVYGTSGTLTGVTSWAFTKPNQYDWVLCIADKATSPDPTPSATPVVTPGVTPVVTPGPTVPAIDYEESIF